MKIPVAHIEPEMRATERDAAISELLHRLVHSGAIPRHAEEIIFKGIIEREETMSTGVGFGIAFPQAQSACVHEPTIAFGRSHRGIQFNAIDGKPVKSVFLFIYPASGDVRQIHVRGQAARFMSSQSASPKTLRDCSTAEEIAEILNKFLFDDDESEP